MSRETIYYNTATGEVTYSHDEAVEWFREKHTVIVMTEERRGNCVKRTKRTSWEW